MKTFQTYILSIICFLVFNTAHSQLYQWQPLTENDAIQFVRDFENNQNLNFEVKSSTNELIGDEGNSILDYCYVLTNGNIEYVISINTPDYFIKRDRNMIYDKASFYNEPYDPVAFQSRVMDENEAKAYADAFLQEHYPYPNILTFVKVKVGDYDYEDFHPAHYKFVYRQLLPNNVESQSDCVISVDSINGKVFFYKQCYFPVLANLTPTITPEVAAGYALAYFNLPNGVLEECNGLGITWPDELGVQRLFYSIYVYTNVPDPNDPFSAYIKYASVDAHDGTVIYVDDVTGSVEGQYKKVPLQKSNRDKKNEKLKVFREDKLCKLTYPPILIDNQPFIYAQYLCYGDKDAKLVDKGKGIWAIESSKRNIVFNLKSKDYSFLDTNKEGQATEAEKKKLPTKPKLINGRLYVPLSALQDVVPFKVGYEKTDKFIWFGTPPKKDSKTKSKESAMLGVSFAPVLAFMGKMLFTKVC